MDIFSYGISDLARIPARPVRSNKGTFGRVLVVGGSVGMSGAAYFAAKAAYRTGAGLVQIMTPEEIDPLYQGRVNLIDSESADISDTKNMKIKITRSSQIAYEEAMKDFVDGIKQFCTSRNADFVSISTDQPIEKVLFKELLKVGIMA
jgi:NAD(P)H-hydrate repair Nnr-like enzyme with NAD(P)H-hydrate dehydratase domain